MKAVLIILNLILMLIIANQDLQAQDKKSKKEQEQEYLENIKKDSIEGVYIPDSPSFATRGLWLFVYNKEICNPSMIYYGFYLQNYLLCV